MTKSLLACMIILSFAATSSAQVKIGSAGTPNVNAVLELDGGTNKGLLLPKLNATQMTALTTAPDGLIIFNTTDQFIYIRRNAAWEKVGDGAGGGTFTLPYDGYGSTSLNGTTFHVTNQGAGNGIMGEATGNGYGIYGYSSEGAGGNFYSSAGPALVTQKGHVGINTLTPGYPLDVNGRMRLRSKVGESAGIWFDSTNAKKENSFIGPVNDSMFGIYSVNGGWKFFFNHANNNFGIYNANPRAPLSFSPVVGNKIDLYYESPTAMYGLGVAGAELQLYSNNAGSHTSIGYGSSTSFKEIYRVNNAGTTVLTNPTTLNANVETGTYFKTGNFYTAAIRSIGKSVNEARTGFFGYSATTVAGLREYMSITDAGLVGIGTVTPVSKLTVSAADPALAAAQITNTGTGYGVEALSSDGTALHALSYNTSKPAINVQGGSSSIVTDGMVGVGNQNPAHPLDVTGRMRLRHIGDFNTAGIYFDGTTQERRSFIGTLDNNTVGLYGALSGWSFLMDVNDGAIMIGTTQKAAGYKVNVAGKIIAEEVRVQLRAAWPDYVFSDKYQLMPLEKVEQFIKTNNHLPGFKQAAIVEKEGADLGETQRTLVEKVEELTLYIIDLKKQIDQQAAQIKTLQQ